jgi:hypothetical protein
MQALPPPNGSDGFGPGGFDGIEGPFIGGELPPAGDDIFYSLPEDECGDLWDPGLDQLPLISGHDAFFSVGLHFFGAMKNFKE